jgi:hypothetical protein
MAATAVSVTRGGVTLHGSLTLPTARPAPVVVCLHGASDGTRDFRLFRHLESLAVPAGIGVLRYDRRGSGASGGDLERASLSDLADDALAWVALVAAREDVDAARIGCWGFSQGGWIGPDAAARSPSIACLALVGACAVTPAEQMAYAAVTALAAAGAGPEVIEQVRSLRGAVDEAMRSGRDRELVRARVAALAGTPWIAHAFLPDPANAGEWRSGKWALEMDYDIGPMLERLAIPTLLIHGEHDRWTPIEASLAAWRERFGSRHPDLLTMVRVPGTGHFPTAARGAEGEEAAPISAAYELVLRDWLVATLVADPPDLPAAGGDLRRARSGDAPAIVALVDAAYEPYVSRIGRQPIPMRTDHAAAIRDDEVWVLDEGGELRGVLHLVIGDDHLLIHNVAVSPPVQGRGLGSRLLDHAERRARQLGRPEVRLYTNERYVENLAIYAARGYDETHRTPLSGTALVHMRKAIS